MAALHHYCVVRDRHNFGSGDRMQVRLCGLLAFLDLPSLCLHCYPHRGGSRISQTRGHRPADVYCDVTIDFSVDVALQNVHPVAGIFLDPLESEVLETIYSLRDLSKWVAGPLHPCLDPPLPHALLIDKEK